MMQADRWQSLCHRSACPGPKAKRREAYFPPYQDDVRYREASSSGRGRSLSLTRQAEWAPASVGATVCSGGKNRSR